MGGDRQVFPRVYSFWGTFDLKIQVVLNTYKRKNLDSQIHALSTQTVKPEKLSIWHNGSGQKASKTFCETQEVSSSLNTGVWDRFLLCDGKHDLYVVFDDDTIPGSRFLENCVICQEDTEGLYSAFGFRFKTKKLDLNTWNRRESFGWASPNSKVERIDWPGHAWCFGNSIMYKFLGMLEYKKYDTCGEDALLAFAAQKLGMNSYVVPHHARETWGSVNGKLGESREALYRVSGQRQRMLETLLYYRSLGWKWCIDD